jgi:hypothetical protein
MRATRTGSTNMDTYELAVQLAEDAADAALSGEATDDELRDLCRRAYEVVDSVAAEQGVAQEGLAWDRLRECRARRLGLSKEARYYGPSDTVDLIADPKERRLATLYGMCSSDPRGLVDMISLIYSRNPIADVHLPRLRESQARVAHMWYGEE